jgi:hypothetical protein
MQEVTGVCHRRINAYRVLVTRASPCRGLVLQLNIAYRKGLKMREVKAMLLCARTVGTDRTHAYTFIGT